MCAYLSPPLKLLLGIHYVSMQRLIICCQDASLILARVWLKLP